MYLHLVLEDRLNYPQQYRASAIVGLRYLWRSHLPISGPNACAIGYCQ
ncbi:MULTISPECIES: hypothetical protein [Aerosakkonema]